MACRFYCMALFHSKMRHHVIIDIFSVTIINCFACLHFTHLGYNLSDSYLQRIVTFRYQPQFPSHTFITICLSNTTFKKQIQLLFACWEIFNDFLMSADSCKHYLLSRVASEYQTTWIQINPNKMSDLNSVQTVCKGYPTKFSVSRQGADESITTKWK